MSDADESDWFRGVRPAKAAATPRPVAEAFGHVAKADDAGDSDWFEAAEVTPAGRGPVPELVAALADAAAAAAPSEPAEPMASASAHAASAEPVGPPEPPAAPAAADKPADSAAAAPPESDARIRLRALTGGLADLSDAMAAIGIESVALRSPSAPRPAAPQHQPQSPQNPQPSQAADFRVRCPDCGPQYVAVSDVRFVETGDGAEANRYLFTCPACGARVRRPAGPELAEILKSSGVATLALRRGPGQAL